MDGGFAHVWGDCGELYSKVRRKKRYLGRGRRERGVRIWTCWIETQIGLKNGNCLRAGNNFKASDTSQTFVDTTIAMFFSLLPGFYAGMLGSILGCLTSLIDNKRIVFLFCVLLFLH